jgi:hypothetical protein
LQNLRLFKKVRSNYSERHWKVVIARSDSDEAIP